MNLHLIRQHVIKTLIGNGSNQYGSKGSGGERNKSSRPTNQGSTLGPLKWEGKKINPLDAAIAREQISGEKYFRKDPVGVHGYPTGSAAAKADVALNDAENARTQWQRDEMKVDNLHSSTPDTQLNQLEPQVEKPKLKIIGGDGNAFAVIGAATKAARKAGWDREKISKLTQEMMSGDYDNVLNVAMKHFDVE
jgi:hypothetical protein